jgi:hypothetical protein
LDAEAVEAPVVQLTDGHPAPQHLSFELLASGGLAASLPDVLAPLVGVEFAALVDHRWRVGLGSWLSFDGSRTVRDDRGRARGSLTVNTVAVMPSLMLCAQSRALPCAGLRVGARIAIGSSGGDLLYQTRTAVLATPTVGLGGRLGLAWGPVLGSLDLSVLVNLAPPRFAVEGLTTTFELPRVDLVLQGALGAKPR